MALSNPLIGIFNEAAAALLNDQANDEIFQNLGRRIAPNLCLDIAALKTYARDQIIGQLTATGQPVLEANIQRELDLMNPQTTPYKVAQTCYNAFIVDGIRVLIPNN